MTPDLSKLISRIPRLRKPHQPPAVPPRKHAVAAAVAVVGLVAAAAGFVSYSHITVLGLRTHQGWTDAHLLAVPIDGLIVAGSVVLACGSRLGWIGVVLGVLATLFANVQYGWHYGLLTAVVSAWPAVAFTAATFMLERWLRSRRKRSDEAAVTPEQSVQGVPRDKLDAAVQAMLATAQAGNPLSGRQLTARFALKPLDAGKVRELVLASMNGHAPKDDPETAS